jgi:histidinol-phosphate aminotransferase
MQIRLDKNEMPEAPPNKIIEAVKLSVEKINRYTPQNEINELIGLLAEYSNVPKKSLILSSGSDILIKEFIFLFSKDRLIITADPTFYLISSAAQKTSSKLLKVKLREPDFKFPIEAIIDEIKSPTLIIIDNPNNPTGSLLLEEKDIKLILENEDVILLIDEAYFEFSNITFSHLIKEYSNLAIARTLSKSFGLAGSGIGYLIAGELTQERFSGLDIMLPYPSVISAFNALKNRDYMYKFLDYIIKEKDRMINSITKLGMAVYPSYTNFLLIKSNINDLPQKLQERDILVSNLSHYSLSSEFIRVSIGTKKENDIFIEVIKKMVESQ